MKDIRQKGWKRVDSYERTNTRTGAWVLAQKRNGVACWAGYKTKPGDFSVLIGLDKPDVVGDTDVQVQDELDRMMEEYS
jgi:hypothetical protein